MSTPRAAELSRLEAESHWDHRTGLPRVRPGSSEEAAALDRIDELREDDLTSIADTAEKRRRRQRHYWGKAGRARG